MLETEDKKGVEDSSCPHGVCILTGRQTEKKQIITTSRERSYKGAKYKTW